jgi:anthranilate synthase component 2
VIRADKVMHGKTSSIRHHANDLFAGIPDPMQVMRYHSLIVESSSLPDELVVLAHAEEDPSEIHAMRHREHPVWGVQFHPESIMTPHGLRLLGNFLELAS